MDEHLLMERIFVEPRSGVEKAFPVINGLGKLLCGLRRKLGYDMKFCRHFDLLSLSFCTTKQRMISHALRWLIIMKYGGRNG